MIKRIAAVAATAALLAGAGVSSADADDDQTVRIATFNASLNRNAAGELLRQLNDGTNEQARNAAETIQRARPDIVLINEFDYEPDLRAAKAFHDNYLKVPQRGAEPVEYPHMWAGPVNTGVPSGHDLNNDGTVGGPEDAFGFGQFPGQYGFVLYSKYPINQGSVRTFQKFLWKDMPSNLIPEGWYSAEALSELRLSSKTHADIPVQVGSHTLHILAAHPTPPSFDGPEKRNKRRNNDEIRLWADYISGKADYLYDDSGARGGLPDGESFAILGDYNSDPVDGDSWPGSIDALLKNSLVLDPKPVSAGAVEAAKRQGGANNSHLGDPALDTADFNDAPRPGNIRVDYTLLSAKTMSAKDSAVFWPKRDDPLFRLVGEHPFPTSDHRLVWVDAQFRAGPDQPLLPKLPNTGR
ncbi:endonuclease/exonuclease/phosphatase family protein [Tessaracoccus sp. OH4464_COT-324]|uniref:endonuclease/exonuclease/phosphatase family protein n=1 Tax=Tessaracoccus sp. OH4464_COT-324 TaxID=2491059 RepID=UPI000F632592|nr:endonuclease/exonuclease/phosphatase family protein [Tessaracoccus sp. OH4464_COT-324]RRD47997.1 endonuclease/exonuclease/phosphatase family protein [Tessaracoccus sp. OH4464_COT-324]